MKRLSRNWNAAGLPDLLATTYQKVTYIPNNQTINQRTKIYQMAVKYTEWT
jgi:protein-disulfide isomerase-like protein with CxxC motif